MRRIFWNIILFVYLGVLCLNNASISFAMHTDMLEEYHSVHQIQESGCCEDESMSPCESHCCVESEKATSPVSVNIIREEGKKLKIIYSYEILNLREEYLKERSLFYSSSPPPQNEENLKEYSFASLTKIIKSNT